MTLQIPKNDLIDLLVESCVLFHDGEHTLDITSLVKDGVSSIAKFTVKVNGNAGEIPVPSIDHLLGVLKYHGQTINFSHENDKLLVSSGKKKTTLASSLNAIAYSSSPSTIDAWHSQSLKIEKKIQLSPVGYLAQDGLMPPEIIKHVDSTDLFEAFRCDGMNGKKTGRYKFTFNENGMFVETGATLKGHTLTCLDDNAFKRMSMVFEGGLEEAMKLQLGNVKLAFIHFKSRKKTAGEWGLIIQMDDDFIFQTSVVE